LFNDRSVLLPGEVMADSQQGIAFCNTVI